MSRRPSLVSQTHRTGFELCCCCCPPQALQYVLHAAHQAPRSAPRRLLFCFFVCAGESRHIPQSTDILGLGLTYFIFLSPSHSLPSVSRSVPALIAMCRDHESLNLQQFEGLMALTNLASLDNVKSRIVAEKGIACFQYLQVKRAGNHRFLPDLLSCLVMPSFLSRFQNQSRCFENLVCTRFVLFSSSSKARRLECFSPLP